MLDLPAPYELLQQADANTLEPAPASDDAGTPAEMQSLQLADSITSENEESPPLDANAPPSEDTADRRISPERIQRPELPPFQRIRPAVDRASIAPPRPQPMRI
jgi:hypothetical protein